MLTDEDIKKRLGKFSGSGIYKLMGAKGFGDTGMTYIYEKAAERLTGLRKEFKPTAEMIRGIELEPIARKHYEAASGNHVVKLDTNSDDSTAWSIDGWITELGHGIEILCPNSENHLRYLLGDISTLKDKYPLKYWQMYFYAWKMNVDKWFFCSFDDRFKGKYQMLILNFPIVQTELNLLKDRVLQANEIIDSIMWKLAA